MDDLNAPLPALKSAIDAVEIQHEGQPMMLLRDQEGISDQALAVSPPGFLVAIMLNGRHSMAEIQALFMKSTGMMLQPEEIRSIIDQLDKNDLLETPALQKKRRDMHEQFSANPVRKAHHMGTGYPENNLDLATFLGKFFKDAGGPQKSFEAPAKPALTGLVSPHIDFARGGPAYAWAYQALSETAPPDLIVGVGVAHMSPNSPWVATPKAYQTPHGPLEFSQDLYDDLKNALWYDPRIDEWVHRTEHSLEFQAVWLKYLWKDKTPPWLPILCSTFERFCPDTAPSTVPTVENALNSFGAALRARIEKGQRILILAGIDMAHVGPRFGDEDSPVTPELKAKIEKEDLFSIEPLLKLNADEFYLSVVKDGHWRKWCGLSALYTSLRLMKAINPKVQPGHLLKYGQAEDPLGGIVSFASITYS